MLKFGLNMNCCRLLKPDSQARSSSIATSRQKSNLGMNVDPMFQLREHVLCHVV